MSLEGQEATRNKNKGASVIYEMFNRQRAESNSDSLDPRLRNIPSTIEEKSEGEGDSRRSSLTSGGHSRRTSLNPNHVPGVGTISEEPDSDADGGAMNMESLLKFGFNKLAIDDQFPGLNLNYRKGTDPAPLNDDPASMAKNYVPASLDPSLSVQAVSSVGRKSFIPDGMRKFFSKSKKNRHEEAVGENGRETSTPGVADETNFGSSNASNLFGLLDNYSLKEENESSSDKQGSASAPQSILAESTWGFQPQIVVDKEASLCSLGSMQSTKKLSTASTANPLVMAMSVSKWKKMKTEEGKKQSIAVDEDHQILLDDVKRRFQVELPRPILIEVQKEAIKVVTHTVQLYKKQLGSKHCLTKQANEHLKLLWQEYADKSEIAEAKQFIFF